MDYNFPILHLENWFNIDDVTLNCQKRKEVQSVILEMVAEQGLTLPPGVTLPDIRFTAHKSNTQNNSNILNSHLIQHRGYHNQSHRYYNNFGDDSDDTDDHDDEECEEEDEEYFDDEEDADDYDISSEYPTSGYRNRSYPNDYNNLDDDYHEIDSENREFFGEIGVVNGEWSEGQHDDDDEDDEDCQSG